MTHRAPISITIVFAPPWHVDDIIGRIKKRMAEDAEFQRFKFLKFPAMSDRYPQGVLFPGREPAQHGMHTAAPVGIGVSEGMPHLWVRNVDRMRKNAPERDAEIRNVTNLDGPYVKIAVGNSSDAKDTISTMRKILRGKRVVLSVAENKDKVVRATPLEPIFKAGNVHVVQGEPWLDDWIAEVGAFPYGAHDDQVGNLSAGYAIWQSQGDTGELYKWETGRKQMGKHRGKNAAMVRRSDGWRSRMRCGS